MKCDHCGKEVTIDCDWRQGRCPHRPPMLLDYNLRFYNLIQFFKKLFTK